MASTSHDTASRYKPGAPTPHSAQRSKPSQVVPLDVTSPPQSSGGATRVHAGTELQELPRGSLSMSRSADAHASPKEGARSVPPDDAAGAPKDPPSLLHGSPSEYKGMKEYGGDVVHESKLIERSLLAGTERYKSVDDANRLLPQQGCKARVWQLMDEPSSSRWAQAIAVMVIFTIVVSTVAFIVETLPPFHRKDVDVWNAIETVCIALFTAEFLLRIFSTPDLVEFCKSFLNIVDFVAIAPFYLEFAIQSDSASSSAVFRVIRLVRVFRVFKISRYLSWVRLFASAMMLSAWPLAMLVFVMAIGTIVFSSLIFYVERGSWDEYTDSYLRSDGTTSPYQSIPASFWWCIVTMTTVGYGDDVPVTAWGRVIAAITSLLGILVLAIPITVISANFSAEYTKLKKQKEVMRARMMLLKNLNESKRSGLDAMFDEIDEIVRRNAQDFRKDIDEVFDRSRAELADELKEVTRMAYEQRRRLYSGTNFPRLLTPSRTGSRASVGRDASTRDVSGRSSTGGAAPVAPAPQPIGGAGEDARPVVRSAPPGVVVSPLTAMKSGSMGRSSPLNPHRRPLMEPPTGGAHAPVVSLPGDTTAGSATPGSVR